MPDLGRSSTIESDPLHAYSGLSLFPRTLKSMSIPLPPLYQSDDLQQTHTLLESMPFEIQKEHQEQANAILYESSELLKQGIGTSVASEDTNVGFKMNPVLNKRERRPALERKRGHFTFKPVISQPPQNEPSFDPSLYPKPEEYFAAYERFLIAQREWQKQTGTLVTETYQNQPSRRPRRPELPGRRRGSYKHTYTDSYFIDLKASEKENPIPSEQSLERNTAAPVKTADREVDESTADTEKKSLENILTELLACSPDELEGDAGVKLLEKRLNIKPIDKQMLSLPDFPEFSDVRRIDLKASKPRTALSNIQNLLKGINSDATRKHIQASASNSPEDQFSFPDRHHLLPGDRQPREVDIAKDSNVCLRSSVANDADKVISNASPSNVDTVHVASDFNSSVQKSSCEGGSDSHSGIHRSHSSPERNADNCLDDNITNINSPTLEVNVDMETKGNEGDVPMSESEANINTGRRENDADINEETKELENLAEYASREDARMDLFTVEEESVPDQQDESSKSPNKPQEQYSTMDGSTEHEEHIQGQHGEENDNTDTAHGPQVEEERIPDQQDESSKSPNKPQEQYNTMDGSTEHEEHIQGQHGEENDNTDTAHEPQVESAQQEAAHNSLPKQTNKRRKRGSYYGNMRKRSKTVHGESERDKQTTTSSHESGAKKETKRKPNERKETKQTKTFTRESKMFSRRNSLGGAGTKWEDGVRRSTRIKSRPLEHWRGERFLYGRIHESMNTVIGIKYESPGEKGKGETRALKVKSFVSDDYKELVDSVAMYY